MMKKKMIYKLALIAVAVIMTFAVLAGCTNTDVDNGNNNGGGDTSPPSQENLWMIELGTILANTIKLNPANGFLMDLSADVAYQFHAAEKQRYNWGYSLSIKGNVFVDGALKQGLMVELLTHTKTVMDEAGMVTARAFTDEEKAAGEDIVLGFYNDVDGNLWLQAGAVKYNFVNVNASVALKSLLTMAGVDLDFNVEDLPLGDYVLGEYIPSLIPLLSMAFENFAKVDNAFTMDLRFSTLLQLADVIVSEVAGNTLEGLLGADVIKSLPQEILMNVAIQTDGSTVKGVDVGEAKVTGSNTSEEEGILSVDTDFTLFGAPAASLIIKDYVNDVLKDVLQSKVFNLSASGEVELLKENVNVGAYKWKINANLDLVKMMEHNMAITGEAGRLLFADNFLHLSLAQGLNPVLDLIYGPDQMGDTDLTVIIKMSWLMNLLGIDLGIVSGAIPEYFVLPVSPDAIVNLVGGSGGDAGGDVGGGGTEGGGTVAPSENDIMETVKKVIGMFNNTDAGMMVDLKGLLGMVELPASIQPMLDKILFQADTARLHNNQAVFAGAENPNYNILNDIKYKTDGTSTRGWTTLLTSNGNIYNKEFEKPNGFLKLYTGSGSDTVTLDASTRPVSVEELNAMMGKAAARFTGTRINGGSASGDSVVVGYSRLNPLLIGEEQTILVYAKTIDASGLLKTAAGVAPEVKPIMDMPLIAFEAKVVLGEIESITDLALLIDGTPIAADKVFTVGDKFDNLSLTATVKFAPNKAYLDGYTISTATVPGIAQVEKINANRVTANGQLAIAAQGAFTVDVSVCGRAFELGFQAEAATSIEVTQTSDIYQGGTNIPNADKLAELFSLKFNYAETSVDGVRLSGVDVEWVNYAEWSDTGLDAGNIILSKTGVMHLKLKVNGVYLEGDWYVTVSDYVPDYNTEYRGVTFENGTASGSFAITGFANTYGGTHDVGAEIKVIVREFQTREIVSTHTASYASDRLTFDGNKTTLPYRQFGDAMIVHYEIGGLDAANNYTLEFVIYNEETARNIASLPAMALKLGIRFTEKFKTVSGGDYINDMAELMEAGSTASHKIKRSVLNITNYWFGDNYGGGSTIKITGLDASGNAMNVINPGSGFLATGRGKIYGGLNGTVTITFETGSEILSTTHEIHT